ncbi:MAG: hypothetical protein LUE09_06375 [Synergistaceae bacterium]|nr:hypothetical protein [Synergistaceae bacterium]
MIESGNKEIYIACGAADMRKSVDGLAASTAPERYHTILPWSKEIPCYCRLKDHPDSMAGDNDDSCANASDSELNDSEN